MIQQVTNILKKYSYDFANVKIGHNLDSIVSQIEEDLIYKPISLDESKRIMCDLWQLQRSERIKTLTNTTLKNEIEDIQKKSFYTIEDNFIVCRKKIECAAIKTRTAFHILNQNQIQKMVDLGYTITSFKIEINSTIRDVYCTGKHPNLSHSGSFCVCNDIKDILFTSDNIDLVETMLSQVNLVSNFLEEGEFNKIQEVLV